MKELAVALLVLYLVTISEASVISKSYKQECIAEDDIRNKNGTVCTQKLVAAITIRANEGRSQFIQANISQLLDSTQKKVKNVELKNPIRIKIFKSPILVNFRLYQVGYVANWPREDMKEKKNYSFCLDVWYGYEDGVNCGFAHDGQGHKIFDSQGICCLCDKRHRGISKMCRGLVSEYSSSQIMEFLRYRSLRVGHCLRFDRLKYFVMGLYPPELKFNIRVVLEQRSYLTTNTNDSGVWEKVSELEIGPNKKIAVSDTHMVKAEYVADFHPNTFISSEKLVHRFLLVPDMSTLSSNPPYPDVNANDWSTFMHSTRNVSEWMAINKNLFDLTGFGCDKIGVSYTAFRRQPNFCTRRHGSCLANQPYKLWLDEKVRQRENRRGFYMLHNFGRVYSLPHTAGRTDFQLNFIADRPTTSLVVLTMAADDLKVVTRVAPGRIISAFIDTFEALSTTGTLLAVIQNTGSFTATYNVFIQHCSAGIDLVPSKTVTIKPSDTESVSFVMHSFHAIGQINYCELNLFDVNGRRLDNFTITFETTDTCFCYGYCGCACGNNKTICPEAPERPDSRLSRVLPNWFDRFFGVLVAVGKFFLNHGSKIFIMFWVFCILICLGVLKIVHMIITQEAGMGAIANPMMEVAKRALKVAEYFYREFCPMVCDNFWSSCANYCRWWNQKCLWVCSCGTVSSIEKVVYRHRIERGWRAPPYCNGMCKGARFKRRVHRKMQRALKRTGAVRETPWFQMPYQCTCKVKDQMPCCKICQGLFFFFYCPLIPVWWVVEFILKYIRRKWRRWRRLRKFRAEREEREQKKRQAYVHLDKYSRGQLKGDIMNLDKEIKAIREFEKDHLADMLGYNPEMEELQLEVTTDKEDHGLSSAASLSDTTDPEEAGEIDELLNPGYPVYFNCAMPKKTHTLQNPGSSYSLKGRLVKAETNRGIEYIFDLHIYTHQVKHQVNNKVKILKPPKLLDNNRFIHISRDESEIMKLVTLAPLFPCLNGKRAKKKLPASKED